MKWPKRPLGLLLWCKKLLLGWGSENLNWWRLLFEYKSDWSFVTDCVNSDGECVSMDSENQLCRDQKGNCRLHGSRWRYKCYKVSCQNNRVEIINASKIDHIGAQEDFMILKKNVKLTVDIIIIFFWQNAVLKIRKVILFTSNECYLSFY